MRYLICLLTLMSCSHPAFAAVTFVDNPAAFNSYADANCDPLMAQTEGFDGFQFAPFRWELGGEGPIVTSQGIDWLSNVPGDPVTTSLASAHSGFYGFYSRMHGQAFPLPSIFDGFRVETDGMCAFSIWMRTTTLTNRPGFILDDTISTGPLVDVVDFNWHFFGVVDPDIFYDLEVTEFLGDPGEPKHMFFDTAKIYVPEPEVGEMISAALLGLIVGRWFCLEFIRPSNRKY